MMIVLVVVVMKMSMRCDYVCELQLPAGLLFIPQVLYEHREPWWNDINIGKPLIRHQSSPEILPAVI
jgi:hypothetical protein